MLVTVRSQGESIRIGDDVVLKIERVERGRVVFAITAPDHVTVRREEPNKQPSKEERP